MRQAMKINKEMKYMLCSVGVLFGLIISYKIFIHFMMRHMISQQMPAVTVAASQVKISEWEPLYQATGSLKSVKGVNVTTEIAGIIQEIAFTSGTEVKKDDLLVQLDIAVDTAQLKSLEAKADYAEATWQRNKTQFKIGAISKEQLQADEANYKSLAQQVKAETAIIAKKTIRAPFEGKLGIATVNPGEYLSAGKKIVNLQTLDPIYVDFNVPQEALAQFTTGQSVRITVDTYPEISFNGKVSAIDPEVNESTRNIAIEATMDNPEHKLLPGMFANVIATVGDAKPMLAIPQTAISFNSYGDIVYVLTKSHKDKSGKILWQAHQRFITTGEHRDDQVAVLDGIKAGETIVTSGQLKIKNGSLVIINDSPYPTE